MYGRGRENLLPAGTLLQCWPPSGYLGVFVVFIKDAIQRESFEMELKGGARYSEMQAE